MSKSCQNCKAILQDDTQFCNQCGQKIHEWSICKCCGECVPCDTKFCIRCGAPISDEQQQDFQANDSGDRFQNNEPQFYANTPHRRSLRKIIVSIVGFMFALLIFAVIFDGTGYQVRQGYLTQYDASITVEEAFNNRFQNCKWSTEHKKGLDYVIFHGYDPNTSLDWNVMFQINEDTFEVSQIEVDGTAVNSPIEIYYLLSYIYTGNLDELMSDIFLAALFLT